MKSPVANLNQNDGQPDFFCPSCGAREMDIFYRATNVPAHSVLLMRTREEALNYPRGTITLGFCAACGFISNVAFDPTLHEYSSRYEETQGYSPTFNEFQRALAQGLLDAHDIRNKTIVEIGCGKGEFLTLLCEMGSNRGIGLDPAYIPERNVSPAQTVFIRDFYSEKYAHLNGDLIVCKMTLEHIQPVHDFIAMIRRSIGERKGTTVFMLVPNAEYILRDAAFWDIYYEHCSYFTQSSLRSLFTRAGFAVLSIRAEYDDQYLSIEAKPAEDVQTTNPAGSFDLSGVAALVKQFEVAAPRRIQGWNSVFRRVRYAGKKVIVWGAGSKAVALLSALKISHDVMPYAVDINPFKQGTFLPGTGQEIVLPDFLRSYNPDVVLVMNPIYTNEIHQRLDELSVRAELISVEHQ
jgi:hypothetical protein